jgi:hypothetical protein
MRLRDDNGTMRRRRYRMRNVGRAVVMAFVQPPDDGRPDALNGSLHVAPAPSHPWHLTALSNVLVALSLDEDGEFSSHDGYCTKANGPPSDLAALGRDAQSLLRPTPEMRPHSAAKSFSVISSDMGTRSTMAWRNPRRSDSERRSTSPRTWATACAIFTSYETFGNRATAQHATNIPTWLRRSAEPQIQTDCTPAVH